MKKAFNECYRAVLTCEDETGRKRCELFRELPDRRVRSYHFFLLNPPLHDDLIGLSRLLPAHHTTYCALPSSQAR